MNLVDSRNKLCLYLTWGGGTFVVRFVTSKSSTLVRVEASTSAWLQHELVHGHHTPVLTMFDAPREPACTPLKLVHLLLWLQLFLCQIINPAAGCPVQVDIWQEWTDSLGIHCKIVECCWSLLVVDMRTWWAWDTAWVAVPPPPNLVCIFRWLL